MSTLNLSLPPAMKAFVAAHVHSGQYSSASDDVRTLIRADQQRQTEALVDATLLDRVGGDQALGVSQAVGAWLRTVLRHPPLARDEARG